MKEFSLRRVLPEKRGVSPRISVDVWCGAYLSGFLRGLPVFFALTRAISVRNVGVQAERVKIGRISRRLDWRGAHQLVVCVGGHDGERPLRAPCIYT